ncbi:response regulator [Hugenholtzia roseola]|uniref:response regulator n=1 Tax=Hugenholtzia roseola TaxID=1002 RepID=UPI0004193DB1|nr:response regulator [Hugenholtzia roseola]
MGFSKTCLIVDDFASTRRVVKIALENKGYEVLEATQGKEALQILQQKNISIVLTDLNMPEMDGIDLVRAIRALERYQNLPVILISTEARSARKQEAFQAGATSFLAKPFTMEQLCGVIEKAAL